MPNNAPAGGFASSKNTDNGTAYFYVGSDAAGAIAASMARVQMATEQKQQQNAQNVMRKLKKNGTRLDPATVSAITVLGAITGTVGAVAAVGGTAAAVGSLGVNIANSAMNFATAMKASGDNDYAPLASAEVTFKNEILGPLVPTYYGTDKCSTASSCMPILPGNSTAVTLMQPNGFKKGDTSYYQNFTVGAPAYLDPDSGAIEQFQLTDAEVKFTYNDDGDWKPHYRVDGMSNYVSDEDRGMTAIYFQPNEGVPMLDFTIVSSLMQKSTGAISVMFLPGSSQIS